MPLLEEASAIGAGSLVMWRVRSIVDIRRSQLPKRGQEALQMREKTARAVTVRQSPHPAPLPRRGEGSRNRT
jgi:hypothetical protein